MPLEKLASSPAAAFTRDARRRRNGLVDDLGTLHDAVIEAKKLAGLDSRCGSANGSAAVADEFLSNRSSATWRPRRKLASANATSTSVSPELGRGRPQSGSTAVRLSIGRRL